MFSGLSENDKKLNMLHRLNTIDIAIQTHDKQLTSMIEYVQKSLNALQPIGSEHKETVLQAVSSKTSSSVSPKSSVSDINLLQKMVCSYCLNIFIESVCMYFHSVCIYMYREIVRGGRYGQRDRILLFLTNVYVYYNIQVSFCIEHNKSVIYGKNKCKYYDSNKSNMKIIQTTSD